MPSLTIPTPTIVHHMAALDDRAAPPNSLEAIRRCLAARAAMIEIDVTALAERDYLLVHDPLLESETSGSGAVGMTAPARARELYIKQRGVVTEHHAALLSDVVALFEQDSGSTYLQLDFKNEIPLPSDEPLQRLVNLLEPICERVLVSTGADWQLRKLRRLAPWLMLGFDVMHYLDWEPPDRQRDPRAFPKHRGAYGYYDDHMLATQKLWSIPEYLRDRCESMIGMTPDVKVFYIDYHLLTQSLRDGFDWAEPLHAHGIKLDAWTMDTTNPTAMASLELLYRAGVDLFTTNTPAALAERLRQ